MLALFCVLAWYVLKQHRLGPPRLRRRQRRRGRPADRHPHRAAAAQRLHRRRPDLRHRGAAADRPHRRRRPAGRADRQPRQITAVVLGGTSLFGGRGTRHRHADRRADRRRDPQRPAADRRRRRSARMLITGVLVILAVAVDQSPGRGGHDHHHRRARRCCRPAGWSSATARDRHRRRRLRPAAGRDPRRHRRQRRRQVQPDQGALRRGRSRTRARSCSTASRSTFRTPIDARAYGIETVYQDLAVAPALDIADEPVPRPRAARARVLWARCFRMLDKRADARRGRGADGRPAGSASGR